MYPLLPEELFELYLARWFLIYGFQIHGEPVPSGLAQTQRTAVTTVSGPKVIF